MLRYARFMFTTCLHYVSHTWDKVIRKNGQQSDFRCKFAKVIHCSNSSRKTSMTKWKGFVRNARQL